MYRLSDHDYEDACAEAIRCLTGAGRKVGVPYTDEAGVRRCTVDGKNLDDRGVIGAWWSESVTRKILYGR